MPSEPNYAERGPYMSQVLASPIISLVRVEVQLGMFPHTLFIRLIKLIVINLGNQPKIVPKICSCFIKF